MITIKYEIKRLMTKKNGKELNIIAIEYEINEI